MKFDPTLTQNNMLNGGLGFLLTQARNSFMRDMEKELAPLNVTSAQFMIIVGIAHGRAHTLTEFSHYLGYDSGALKRLLDRIEDKGLIRRVRCAHDRRTWILQLTDAGAELYPKIMQSVSAIHARKLDAFEQEDIDQLRRYLHVMIAPA